MFAIVALRLVFGLVFASLFVLPLAAEGLAIPNFVSGELSSLKCKPGQVKSFAAGTSVFSVEVANSGALACEPMVFRCEWKDGKGEPVVAEIARAPYPRGARVGRSVPAKGKESYVLQVAAAETKGLKVSVIEALFSDAERVERVPLRVGRIEHGHGQLDTRRVVSSSFEIENELPHVVDFVLRGRCTAPKDATVLFTATVGPRGVGRLDLLAMPLTLEWREPLHYYPGAEVAEIELVDWSARVGTTSADARALLEPAYRSWLRHANDTPALEARYTAARESVWDERPTTASGTCTVSSAGRVSTKPTSTDGNAIVHRQVEELFASMRRPSFEELLETHELELVAPGIVALHGPGFGRFVPGTTDLRAFVPGETGGRRPVADAPTFRIGGDGRILAFGTLFDPDATLLETRSFGNGWVVAVERNRSGTSVVQYVHQLHGDLVVPGSRRTINADAVGKVLIEESCRLESVVFVEEGRSDAATPPSGAHADALRAHWERLFRYGNEPVELSGRFIVESPATDFVWLGARKVEGRFELGGFRGFALGDRVWSKSSVTVAGKLSPRTSAALGDAFLDRFVLWAGRDPAGIGSFDEQFRGAQVVRLAEREVYELDRGWIEAVRVEGGRIASIRFRSGIERKYTWKETPAGLVATRVESGDEVLEAKWSEVAKGRWLPTEFEFRKVFGPEWGPETIRLTSLVVR